MHPLAEYFRCPPHLAAVWVTVSATAACGYFRFLDAICYGRQTVGAPASRPDGSLVDVAGGMSSANGAVLVPFDLSEVLDNLRRERYLRPVRSSIERVSTSRIARGAYYFCRPFMGVPVRKYLQRLSLAGWRRIAFPRWPVDVTVETVMKRAAGLVLKNSVFPEFPFVWFWPDGAPGCVMMTHDVEGPSGADRAGELMDLDDHFGIRSAFQLVPEAKTSRRLLAELRRRGFEVNLHDLNHDGRLFNDRALFDSRAKAINRYVREWGCRGFR